MNEVTKKTKCISCGVCKLKCPTNAITMEIGKLGFEYPQINQEKCVNCGLCQKICPTHHNRDKNVEKYDSYYSYTKDKDILKNSSSGGVFGELAKYILAKGGVVYGASLSEDLELSHIKIDKLENLSKILGSKYMQSDIKKSLKSIEKDLINNKDVLFCGSPCQVHALKLFLMKDYDNLITVDFICSGVPSNLLWKSYIKSIEDKHDNKVISCSFRDKTVDWENFEIVYKFIDKQKFSINHTKDSYFRCFVDKMLNRDSCYQCVYKKNNFYSDLTIGDFWGIEKIKKDYNKEGSSCVILRTSKSKYIFDDLKDLISYSVDYNDIAIVNWPLETNCVVHINRSQIARKYKNEGNIIKLLDDSYNKINFFKKIKKKLIILLNK